MNKTTNLEVYRYGQYYNPAHIHYKNPLANVSCDRCFRSNLEVSIGYRDSDLCLKCVYIMSKSVDKQAGNNILSCAPKPQTTTRMKQGMYSSYVTTYMEQDIFNTNDATFMMQDMYFKK